MTENRRNETDYLFDPAATPDPEILRLERELAPLSYEDEPFEWPDETPRREAGRSAKPRRRAPWLAPVAALAAVLLAALGLALWLQPLGEAWDVYVLGGAPRIDGRTAERQDRLRPGARLTTGDAGRVRLDLPSIGQLDLEAGSELVLVRSRPGAQRFRLERGRLEARVWAPPRVFQVDTPAVRAVDLGCIYELSVDDRGAGRLAVVSGWVALVDNGRESFVPAGAWAAFDRRGPGIPLWNEAPEKLKDAVARLEAPPTEERSSWLDTALASARERDALTLWHLLARARPEERETIAVRLAELAPPPPEAPRAAVVAGEREALDAWWAALDLGSASWWREWRQPMP